MQLTLALLELPAPPAMPGVPPDPEARAKAIETLARMIADPRDLHPTEKRGGR